MMTRASMPNQAQPGGMLLVCYAIGDDRRVVLARGNPGDCCWYVDGLDLSFDEGHPDVCDAEGIEIAGASVVGWVDVDWHDGHWIANGEDTVHTLAPKWGVTPSALYRAGIMVDRAICPHGEWIVIPSNGGPWVVTCTECGSQLFQGDSAAFDAWRAQSVPTADASSGK